MLLSACLYCGSVDLIPAYKRADGREIDRCGKCDLLFIRDIPEDIESLYGAEYFKKSGADSASQGLGYDDYAGQETMGSRWQASLLRLFEGPRAHRGTKLLDLGCAMGRFLQMAATAGFWCTGLELSGAAASATRALGFPVVESALQYARPAGQDIVTAWDFLEHVTDLRGTLAKVRTIVKKGGCFLFATPDGGSARAQEHGERWICLNSSMEHITYLTEPFLQQALREHFEVDPELLRFDVGAEWSSIIGFVRVGGATPRDRRIAEILRQSGVPETQEEWRELGFELGLFYASFAQTDALSRLASQCEGNLSEDMVQALQGLSLFCQGEPSKAVPYLKTAARLEPLVHSWLARAMDNVVEGLTWKLTEQEQRLEAETRHRQHLEQEIARLQADRQAILDSVSWKIGRGITGPIERVPLSRSALASIKQLLSR